MPWSSTAKLAGDPRQLCAARASTRIAEQVHRSFLIDHALRQDAGQAITVMVNWMPLYARYGVPHLWLVDPVARTLEAYTLVEGAWKATGAYRGNEAAACAEPFAQISIDLASLCA